jgi:hypothetical protein
MATPTRPASGETRTDNTALVVIVVVVVCLLVTFAFYYFAYRLYSTGQDTCDALYPGRSLRAMRAREECKDRKRGNWALPAALIFASNWN